jgi:hypothetical protein
MAADCEMGQRDQAQMMSRASAWRSDDDAPAMTGAPRFQMRFRMSGVVRPPCPDSVPAWRA